MCHGDRRAGVRGLWFAMSLKSMGYDAPISSWIQAAIRTDPPLRKAKSRRLMATRIFKELEKNRIVAVAGFKAG